MEGLGIRFVCTECDYHSIRESHLGDHMLVHTREYENCTRTRSEVVYSYLYCVLIDCSINTKHSFIFSHTHMYKCCGCYTCSVVGDICEPKKYTCFFMKSVYILYRLNALAKYFFSRIKFYTIVLMDRIYADLISSLSHLSINKLEKRHHSILHTLTHTGEKPFECSECDCEMGRSQVLCRISRLILRSQLIRKDYSVCYISILYYIIDYIYFYYAIVHKQMKGLKNECNQTCILG